MALLLAARSSGCLVCGYIAQFDLPQGSMGVPSYAVFRVFWNEESGMTCSVMIAAFLSIPAFLALSVVMRTPVMREAAVRSPRRRARR